MANQVDFKILPSDQFNVYSPQTRSEKVITYFTLLSKLRGDILAVSSQDDPNSIVSAYYTNVGNTQTLHLVKADGSEVTASNSFAGTVTSVGVSMPSAFTVTNSPITTSGTIQITGAGTTAQYVRGDGTLATFPSLTGFVPYVGATQNVDLGEYQIKAGQVAFDLTPTGTAGVGIMRWNDQDGTVDLGLLGGNVTLQVGQEQVVRVVNKSGINLTEAGYQAVKITGAQGNRLKVGLAQANNDANSADTIGLVTENIALNAEGFVTSSGLVHNIDTTGALQGETWADGDVIYLSPTTPGAVTKVKPTAPQHTVILGFVVRAHQTQGQIYVKVDNGYELEELHDVAPTPYVNNGVLYRDTATNLWKSATIPTVLGYTPANSTTTISTTAPLSGGGNLSANRTLSISQAGASSDGYLSSTDWNTFNSKQGALTFTAPLVNTGGTVTITQAGASANGYLSSTDWNTFNNKASDAFKTIAVTGQSNIVADSPTDTLTFEAGSNIVITTDAANDKITINALGGGSGSVTSVDMSVPTGFSISGNPITTSGTLALAFASGYSLPTNASQANWNTAYDNSITAFAYNTSTGVLTLTQQDAGTLTATVTLQPFTTDNLTQGSTNLYDKVVSLTGAGTTVVTGTYPNFTITSNDQHVGTVTSIATSAPITGGTITTSGTIGITKSGASADGYLSSTDWNTFNSKVGGSGTVNYVSKWTSTGAIGNSQIFDSGTYVGINTATPAAKLDISGAHVASIGLLRLNSSASNVAAQTYYIDGVYKAATYAGTDDNFYILGRDADIVFSTTSSTTTRMVITNGGNVGIGTSGPTQKLMVSGSIRVTGGYYDSSNSIGSNGQVLASTGSGTTWINASGGTVNGSGTVNYLSKWTGTTLLGDSLVYDNGTYVGIGTTAPGAKLDVLTADPIRLRSSGTTGYGAGIDFYHSSSYRAYVGFPDTSAGIGPDQLLLYTGSAYPISFYTNNTERVRITSGGNVGIGNNSPSQKLHVEGNIRVTGAYYDSANGAGSSGQVLSSTGSGTSWITPFSASGTTNYVAKWTSGTALGNSQIFDNGTNVGIGTASPTETLDLRGVLRVSRSGVNDSGIIAFGNYVNGAGYYDNGIFRSALNAITTSGNTLHMGSYEALAFTTSANPLGSQSIRMYISGSNGNVGIGTTSPSRMLHVAGNAQVDGWLFQGGYYTGSVTLPYPGANYGNGRIYLRLCSSASGRIMTAKVRISSTWNWAPAFGSVEADISFYWNGSSLVYSYVNILSATGQAATNLTFGALEVEGGSISVPVYSTNSNPIYAYIQLSPDADPSQVSYSTWSSVAFPGQANVYIQTNLGLGTSSPGYRLDINGVARFQDQVRFKTNIWQISDSDGWNRFYFSPGSRTYFGSGDGYEWRSSSDTAIAVITNGGNLGINETAPSQKLHVSGNVRVTGAYYDSSNASGTSGQILSSTGTGTAWISPGGGGGIITGSGTTNYVTKWTGTSAVGNSVIYDNGTSVGVGTTTPNPFSWATKTITVVSSASNSYAALEAYGNGTGAGALLLGNTSILRASILAEDGSNLLFATNAGNTGSSQSERMRITAAGNVGIGTTSPSELLDVNASSATTGYNDFVAFRQINGTGTHSRILFGQASTNNMFIEAANQDNIKGNLILQPYGGNVGIGTADPIASLDNQGSYGTYRQRGLTTMVTNNLGAAGTQAKRFEIARASIDYNDWNTVGPIEVELYERYYSRGLKKKYVIYYGYVSAAGCNLVEMTGSGDNQFMVSIGPEVVISGDNRYIPIYVDVRYYSQVTAVVKTNRELTLTNPPGNGSIWMNNIPTGVDISDFTPDSTVYVGNIIGGNSVFTTGNVGIGTTAPGQKLEVNGNIIATPGNKIGFRYDSSDANLYGYITRTGAGGVYPLTIVGGLETGGTTIEAIRFETLTAGTARMSILNNGNVGINETAPSQKLHVSGNIRVTGAYYDSANSAGTSGQILSSTGTGTAWIAAPSGGGVSGSGTTNYITKWTSGSAVGDSIMYDAGTGIGVGTTTPLLTNTGRGNLTVNGSSDAVMTLGIGGSWASYWYVNSTAAYLSAGNPRALVLEAGNSARIFITSGGNVGIGTTSPSEKFVVSDGGAAGFEWVPSTGRWYRYNRSTSAYGGIYTEASEHTWSIGTSEAMRINGSGNVGIGTTAPGSRLDVKSPTGDGVDIFRVLSATTGSSVFRVYATTGVGGGLASVFDQTGTEKVRLYSTGDSYFNGGNVGIGTTAPGAKLQINDGTGSAEFLRLSVAYDTSRSARGGIYWHDTANTTGRIYTEYDGTMTSMVFGSLYNSGYNSNNLMIIRGNGNVGIGTTAPSSKLTVIANNRSFEDGENAIRIEYPGSPSNGEIGGGLVFAQRWFSGDPNSLIRTGGIYGVKTNGNGAFGGGLVFYTQPNNGDPMGERMRINSSGNVGINTTSPSYKLDVIGSVRSYGGLISNGYHADTYIENLLPAANNGAGQGDVQLRMWCSEPGITWSWAGFGYNVKNDGASPYGFGRVNTSFGQAYMRFSTDGNLYFYNANTSGTRVETMTLTNGGNVGIGTTAPTFKLDVRDGTNAIVRVLDTSTNNSLIMQAGTGAGMKITGYNYNTSTAVPLYISVDGANTIMQTGGGNVGIGTTAPAEKLSVVGNIRSAGNVIASVGLGYGNYISMRHDDVNGYITITRTVYAGNLILEPYANVGISTTTPSYKLDVSGTIRATGDVIAYSDARVKENIETLDGALDKVMKMRGVSYNKIGEQEKKVGVIAQEILEVLPEVVSQDESGTYSVAYGNIVSVLIEAIKEQQKQIDELKAKLK